MYPIPAPGPPVADELAALTTAMALTRDKRWEWEIGMGVVFVENGLVAKQGVCMGVDKKGTMIKVDRDWDDPDNWDGKYTVLPDLYHAGTLGWVLQPLMKYTARKGVTGKVLPLLIAGDEPLPAKTTWSSYSSSMIATAPFGGVETGAGVVVGIALITAWQELDKKLANKPKLKDWDPFAPIKRRKP